MRAEGSKERNWRPTSDSPLCNPGICRRISVAPSVLCHEHTKLSGSLLPSARTSTCPDFRAFSLRRLRGGTLQFGTLLCHFIHLFIIFGLFLPVSSVSQLFSGGEQPAVRMDKSALLLLLLCCLFVSSSGSPLYPSIRWAHTRGLKPFTLSLLAAWFIIYIYFVFHSRLFQSTTQLWIAGKIVNWQSNF